MSNQILKLNHKSYLLINNSIIMMAIKSNNNSLNLKLPRVVNHLLKKLYTTRTKII